MRKLAASHVEIDACCPRAICAVNDSNPIRITKVRMHGHVRPEIIPLIAAPKRGQKIGRLPKEAAAKKFAEPPDRPYLRPAAPLRVRIVRSARAHMPTNTSVHEPGSGTAAVQIARSDELTRASP